MDFLGINLETDLIYPRRMAKMNLENPWLYLKENENCCLLWSLKKPSNPCQMKTYLDVNTDEMIKSAYHCVSFYSPSEKK